jgi:hypothetical protein
VLGGEFMLNTCTLQAMKLEAKLFRGIEDFEIQIPENGQTADELAMWYRTSDNKIPEHKFYTIEEYFSNTLEYARDKIYKELLSQGEGAHGHLGIMFAKLVPYKGIEKLKSDAHDALYIIEGGKVMINDPTMNLIVDYYGYLTMRSYGEFDAIPINHLQTNNLKLSIIQ